MGDVELFRAGAREVGIRLILADGDMVEAVMSPAMMRRLADHARHAADFAEQGGRVQ